MSTGNSRARSISTTPITVHKGSILVILSWGSVAWYLCARPAMTVGELREQLAKTIGRLFGRTVVGLELLITGTIIPPELHISLGTLTHAGCRNVCLDVTAGSPASMESPIDSIAERLLRRHMTQEPFQVGVDQGLWRLVAFNWPRAIFGILSADGNKRCEVGLRLNFQRYPLAPPLVELWDVEAQTRIDAQRWPEPFIRFASQNYPQFVELETAPYCSNLLRVSIEVARRLTKPTPDAWDVSGDLTQILSRVSGCFRGAQSRPLRSLSELHQGNNTPVRRN
jgi:hypothetical protein